MSNDNSYISLGPLPPPPTFRRSYNTDRENMSATTIQSNERIRQAKEQVRKIKQDIRINNLALNTLQQGFNILKNNTIQRELKKALGLNLNGRIRN